MSKDIIFYSNYCNFSKEVIGKLNNTSIRDSFLYICVDDTNINLPTFVKAVPTIYLAQQKRILVDESIDMWLNSIGRQAVSQQSNNSGSGAIPASGDIGFYDGGNGSFSSCFSTLDDKLDSGMSFGFHSLNTPLERINTPEEGSKNSGKKSLDDLQKQRSLDVPVSSGMSRR